MIIRFPSIPFSPLPPLYLLFPSLLYLPPTYSSPFHFPTLFSCYSISLLTSSFLIFTFLLPLLHIFTSLLIFLLLLYLFIRSPLTFSLFSSAEELSAAPDQRLLHIHVYRSLPPHRRSPRPTGRPGTRHATHQDQR